MLGQKRSGETRLEPRKGIQGRSTRSRRLGSVRNGKAVLCTPVAVGKCLHLCGGLPLATLIS